MTNPNARFFTKTWIGKNFFARNDGVTLIEVLVVLAIMSMLVGLIAPRTIRYLSGARTSAAVVQIKNINAALDLYYLDNFEYPNMNTGLNALLVKPSDNAKWNGPYLDSVKGVIDPWGRSYLYKYDDVSVGPILYSLGQDGELGGEDENKDIFNKNFNADLIN